MFSFQFYTYHEIYWLKSIDSHMSAAKSIASSVDGQKYLNAQSLSQRPYPLAAAQLIGSFAPISLHY